MNVPPYILQQGIAARHADLVRQADAARLAARSSSRIHLLASLLKRAASRRPRPGFRATLESET